MNWLRKYAFSQMIDKQAKRLRWIAALLLATSVALLGFLVRESFVASSYDLLHSLASLNRKSLDDSRVVIVYLDLASYIHEHQDPANRWPRALHAKLLERMTTEGARAVVFDILFDSPSEDSSADHAFAAAMKKNSRVILATEHNNKISHQSFSDQNRTRSTVLRLPEKLFADAAAGWGIASLWVDDDFVVRRHLPALGADRTPNLSLAAATFIGATNDFFERPLWVRYYGPALTIPHVSYNEALDPAALPPNFFRDKIVFIGARPIEGFMDARRDEFRSPFHAWSNKEYFMPGVEVHATQLLNRLRGDALKRISPANENFLIVAVALIFGVGLLWLRPVPATIMAACGAGVTLGSSLAGFSKGVWFPWLVVSAVQIPGALFGSWLWQFQDWFFTRRKLEAAKRIADAKIREQAALIEKAHDAILVQSLDGKIIYANPSAEILYGWKFLEFKTDTAAEIFSPDAAAAEKARASAIQEGEWNGELRQQTKSGCVVIVASRWTLIRETDGKPKELLLINRDITEQKELEQQFLRTQRMNTIGALAGGMAHDLNNALAPILMGTQMLRRKAVDTETRELLSLMETSTHRGADMVRQVLLFARGRGGEFEQLKLGAIVVELEKMVRETFPKNIAVKSFLPNDLWPVRGNPTQLHQVLLNLCVNARDAMPSGGKISFVADNVNLSAIEVADLPGGRVGQFISLSVSDSGTGMPPEVRAKIFEPFFTTKGEGSGTGIGLATVLRIVKAHDGFLRVESEPGQGTTFEILLPRASEVELPEAVGQVQELPRGNGEMILLVDDEKAIRELIESELTSFGYRILSAANGAEAMSLFRQHSAEVRLLITDNSMPLMDGQQLIFELRTLRRELPVILSSGEGNIANLENVTRLNKPFALDDLLRAIQRNIGSKR